MHPVLLLLLATAAFAQTAPALSPGQARLKGDAHGSFQGTVFDRDTGEPLRDVPLVLVRPSLAASKAWPEPWTPETWDEDEELARVTTTPDGRYRFDGLPDGSYRVQTDTRWLMNVAADGYVEGGGPIDRELRLPGGATVRGRVEILSERDAGNLPVFLGGLDQGDGLNSGKGRPPSMPTRASADGTFELKWISAGKAYLQAGHDEVGYSDPIVLDLAAGDVVEDLLIRVPDESEALGPIDTNGRVGVRLEFTRKGPLIKGIVPELPAARAGLKAGDRIVTIDGKPTRFMTSREFIRRCRGILGSTVTLVWERDGEQLEATMPREVVPARDKP